jgi:dynein heavy chain
MPQLDLFDDKITNLKSIQNEIIKINTPQDISWLRINLQPLKSALENKVTGWI